MKLIKGNCLLARNAMPPQSVDCIITSPPYNIGKKYHTYVDKLPYKEYLNWIEEIAKTFSYLLKRTGHIFLNVGYTSKEPWIAMDVAQRFRSYFVLQNNIKWIKHIKIDKDTFGIYKPISSPRYTTPVWEDIFHFTCEGNCPVNRVSISGEYGPKKGTYASAYTPKACRNRYENTVKRVVCKKLYGHNNWKSIQSSSDNETFNCAVEEYQKRKPFVYNKPKDEGNVWYIPYTPVAKLAKELGSTNLGTNSSGKSNHPAVFPVELPARCLKFADYKKDWVVLDPFLGTGTTLVACQQLGILNSIGIDIDKHYIEFTKKRIKAKMKMKIIYKGLKDETTYNSRMH